MDTSRKLISNKKGFALVYIALAIFALVGLLGLSIDLGHLYVVRGELQNAADASALAGAAALYKDPGTSGATSPYFTNAEAVAAGFISQNKSDGVNLIDGSVTAGYWNRSSNNLDPPTTIPTNQHIAAVTATISRSSGNNGGAVPTFFARVFGVDQSAVSSRQAVATVQKDIGAVPPGALFPMALASCMTDYIFSLPQAEWSTQTVNINSPYGSGGAGCYSGQWTSFKLDKNDVPTIRDLMQNGNPDGLQTGEYIWIEPGTEATLYQTDKWPIALPAEVLMAIVDSGLTDLKTKGERKITGFATFVIDGAVSTGKEKYIYGHFTNYYRSYPGTSPGGSASNTVTSPQMVQ